VKKNQIDHLIDGEKHKDGSLLQQRCTDMETQKLIKQEVQPKSGQSASDPGNASIFTSSTHNNFTLHRDLNFSVNDLFYRVPLASCCSKLAGIPYKQPCVRGHKDAQKWRVIEDDFITDSQDGLSRDPYDCCKFCANLQHIHLYLNVRYGGRSKRRDAAVDEKVTAVEIEGFTVIQNPEIIKILKSHVLKMADQNGSAEGAPGYSRATAKKTFELPNPLIFGSFTGWKVYEMLPAQIYTLGALRDQLAQHVLKDLDDPLNHKLFRRHLRKLFCSSERKRHWDTIRREIPDLGEFLEYVQTRWHFEHMRSVDQFNKPTPHTSWNRPKSPTSKTPTLPKVDITRESFVFPILSTPGRHSVIAYLPEQEIFCCRNIVVGSMKGQYTCSPSLAVPRLGLWAQQTFDPLRADIFAEHRLENERNARLNLLKDLRSVDAKALRGLT